MRTIVSTGHTRTIARGISGLNRSSSYDLARISLLEDSESETTVHWSIYDCHGILTSSRILTQLFIYIYVYIAYFYFSIKYIFIALYISFFLILNICIPHVLKLVNIYEIVYVRYINF